MFNPFRKEDPQLEAAIASIYKDLETMTSDDDEYAKMVEQLVKLNALKNQGIDPNTLLTVLGNIGIAGAILAFEQKHVITTKLTSFLMKR